MEKQTPFRTFRFRVEVDGLRQGAASFSQFSGVKMQVKTIRARTGEDSRGVQQYIPVFTSFAPVTLSKGVIRDPEFMDWLLAASAGAESGPSGKSLRRTLTVTAIDDRGRPGVAWVLKDAMPIGYELSAMNAGSSEILTESLTFAITGMTRQKIP